MDTTIRQALTKASTPPQDSITKEIIGTITNFIEAYGVYLKTGTVLKFKILTSRDQNGGCNFTLLPPNENYGNFSTVYKNIANHIGPVGLVNLLRNSGAKIVSDDMELDSPNHEYLVEFVIT